MVNVDRQLDESQSHYGSQPLGMPVGASLDEVEAGRP